MKKLIPLVLLLALCGCGRWTLDSPTEPVAGVSLRQRGAFALGQSPYAVCVRWPYVFVSYYGASLEVISFANPDAPASIATVQLPEGQSYIIVEGSYLYAYNYLLTVLDVGQIAAPQQIASIDRPWAFVPDGNSIYFCKPDNFYHFQIFRAVFDSGFHVTDSVACPGDLTPRQLLKRDSPNGKTLLYFVNPDRFYWGDLVSGPPFFTSRDSMTLDWENPCVIAGPYLMTTRYPMGTIDYWRINGDGSPGPLLTSSLPSDNAAFTCGDRLGVIEEYYTGNRLYLMNVADDRVMLVASCDAGGLTGAIGDARHIVAWNSGRLTAFDIIEQ